MGGWGLGVFSEGVVAFGATEELRGGFVSASGLNLPNVDLHVAAFGALHPHSWHGLHVVLFADDCDLLLQRVFDDFPVSFGLSGIFGFGFDVAAFWAGKADASFRLFRHETGAAVWAKLHNETPILN